MKKIGYFLHATARSWKESISTRCETPSWDWRLPTLSREWRNVTLPPPDEGIFGKCSTSINFHHEYGDESAQRAIRVMKVDTSWTFSEDSRVKGGGNVIVTVASISISISKSLLNYRWVMEITQRLAIKRPMWQWILLSHFSEYWYWYCIALKHYKEDGW